MNMDFRKGMKCICCSKQNSFVGGHFGSVVTSTKYICDCGFKALLLIPDEDYYIEYKGIKKEEIK